MLNWNLNLTLIFIFQEKTTFFFFFCKSILLNLIRIWIRDRSVVSLRLVNTICFIKETVLMFSYWLSSSEDNLCIVRYSYGRESHEFCQKVFIFLPSLSYCMAELQRETGNRLLLSSFLLHIYVNSMKGLTGMKQCLWTESSLSGQFIGFIEWTHHF